MESLGMGVAFDWVGPQGQNLAEMCRETGAPVMPGCVSVCIVVRQI